MTQTSLLWTIFKELWVNRSLQLPISSISLAQVETRTAPKTKTKKTVLGSWTNLFSTSLKHPRMAARLMFKILWAPPRTVTTVVKRRKIHFKSLQSHSLRKNQIRRGINQIHLALTRAMEGASSRHPLVSTDIASLQVVATDRALPRARAVQMLLCTSNRMQWLMLSNRWILILTSISIWTSKIKGVASLLEVWWCPNSSQWGKIMQAHTPINMVGSEQIRCNQTWCLKWVDQVSSWHSSSSSQVCICIKERKWQLTKWRKWTITRFKWSWWTIKIWSPTRISSNINSFRARPVKTLSLSENQND